MNVFDRPIGMPMYDWALSWASSVALVVSIVLLILVVILPIIKTRKFSIKNLLLIVAYICVYAALTKMTMDYNVITTEFRDWATIVTTGILSIISLVVHCVTK